MKLSTVITDPYEVGVRDYFALYSTNVAVSLGNAVVGPGIVPSLGNPPPAVLKPCGTRSGAYVPHRVKEADILGWPQDVVLISPSEATRDSCLLLLQIAEEAWPEELRAFQSPGSSPEYIPLAPSVRRYPNEFRFINFCVLLTSTARDLYFQCNNWRWRTRDTVLLYWDYQKRKLNCRIV